MPSGNMSKRSRARGSIKGSLRRAVVSFDKNTFLQISELAEKEKKSLAGMIREIVDIGLATIDEEQEVDFKNDGFGF